LGGCAVIPVRPLLRELIVELVALEIDRHSRGDHATAIASLVLAEMTRLPTQPLHVPLPTATRLRRICEEVQADPGSVRTSAEWSARFGLSAKTLERDFSKGLAMTFGRWRQQVRLLASLERLADGEAVTRVAMDLGYTSPSAFAAMFRKALGCSPSRYFA
jgi:AraC-like DNA-binding protein